MDLSLPTTPSDCEIYLDREAASTVTRESENGRTCAPHAMAKSGTGVARLRCAPFVAVVQAADLRNGDRTSRSQRRDRTWKGCILVSPRCVRVRE
jgi:hypothetical protein